MSDGVLLIGLDVGDGGLLREWAEAGELPVLGELVGRGAWHRLDTTADVLHVSAWPSLYTGASPGEHGVYFTFQSAPGVQGWQMFHGDLYGRPTFWSLLSRAGVRCTVFDAPYVHPEEGSPVTQVFDWGTWARHWKTSSEPAGLLRRLKRASGSYPLELEALDLGLLHVDSADVSRRLVDSVAAKGRATRWLMDAEPWDLFFVAFGETHPAAHYCYDPGDETGRSADLLAVYRAIDRAIGEIVEHAGPDVVVHVVSGDGVGPNHGGWHLLPEVLRRLGFLTEPAPDEGAESRDIVRRVRDMLPKDFRKRLARKLPGWLRHRLAKRVDVAGIDWERTRAFCLPTDLEGYVRINLRGREPRGIVDPGAPYDAACAELAEALLELTDPVSGGRAVSRVVRVAEELQGRRSDQLPDLVVLWDSSLGQLDALASPRVGNVEGAPVDARPGTHAAPGFLLTVRSGGAPASSDVPHPVAHVLDVAPMLLSHFGVTIPSYMISPGTNVARDAEQSS